MRVFISIRECICPSVRMYVGWSVRSVGNQLFFISEFHYKSLYNIPKSIPPPHSPPPPPPPPHPGPLWLFSLAWTFWIVLWCYGSRFDVSACVLTFWLALWCFGSHFDVSACAFMVPLVLWWFGLRFGLCFNGSGRVLTFWLALW